MSATPLIPSPVFDTWTNGQFMPADWLNRNVRDSQTFIANAPLTVVMRSVTQSIATSTSVPIVWDTEVTDMDGLFTAPSANLVIRRPGTYSVQLNVPFAVSSAGVNRGGFILVNGTIVAQEAEMPAQTNATCVNCSALVALNAGDVLTANAWQDTGLALNIGGIFNGPRLSVRLVSTAQLDVNYSNPAPPISTPPTGGTPTWHTNIYPATWTRSYDGNLNTTWDDSVHCFQGNESQYRGMTRSLVGFDYPQLQVELSGASNMSMWFYFTPAHTWFNSGMTVIVGSHTYFSVRPATWSFGNVYVNQLRRSSCTVNITYNVKLTPWHCWAFQNSVIAGMAFGPAPSTDLTYYGYMRGFGEGSPPYLSIQYTK